MDPGMASAINCHGRERNSGEPAGGADRGRNGRFAEGSGQSAGEFYTPPEVGTVMSRVLAPEPGMTVYDPCCGSGGLHVKLETAMEEKAGAKKPAPLRLFGQEYIPVPTPGEQVDIVKALETVDQKLVGHQGKLGALQDLFRTLLHELMSAKTRVYELKRSA